MVHFGQLRDLTANISGTQQGIVNRKTALQTTDIPRTEHAEINMQCKRQTVQEICTESLVHLVLRIKILPGVVH